MDSPTDMYDPDAKTEEKRRLGETASHKLSGLPEEAVLKIVANLDQTALSAEAMKLTQVGFIDCLRRVTRDKFQTLKQVKGHFISKVDRVVMAKDYQIKC